MKTAYHEYQADETVENGEGEKNSVARVEHSVRWLLEDVGLEDSDLEGTGKEATETISLKEKNGEREVL